MAKGAETLPGSHRIRGCVRLAILALFVVTASCAERDDASTPRSAREISAPDTGRFVDSQMVLVAVVAPEVDEESGIITKVVAMPQRRAPILRADTLYADGAALAAAIGVNSSVSLDGIRIRVDSRTLDVRGFRTGGGIYVPVRAFARELGAFTYPERDAQGITVYPRAALEYLRANRERQDEVPVLRGAREQGLLPAR
jgi:hypothetical protein